MGDLKNRSHCSLRVHSMSALTLSALRQAMGMCPLLGGRESRLCLVPRATSNGHVLLEATGA